MLLNMQNHYISKAKNNGKVITRFLAEGEAMEEEATFLANRYIAIAVCSNN